MPLLIKVPVPS